MKKRIILGSLGVIVVVCIIIGVLIIRGNIAMPIRDFDDSKFSVIYSNDKIEILEREYDEDVIYTLPQYNVGLGDETCSFSGYENYNFVIKRHGRFYELRDAGRASMFTCDDLYKAGVIERD